MPARIPPRSRQRPRHGSGLSEVAGAATGTAPAASRSFDDDDNDKTNKGGSHHHHPNQRPAGMSAVRYHCSRLWIMLKANRAKLFSMWLASAGLKIVVLGILFGFGLISSHGPEFPFAVLDGTEQQQEALLSAPRVDVTKLPSARQPARHVPVIGLTSRRRLTDMGYKEKPRALGYYFNDDGSLLGTQRLDPYLERRQKEKSVYVEEGRLERQLNLKNSRDYRYRRPDPIPEGCSPQYEWQTTTYPSCNQAMEMDLTTLFVTGLDGISHEATRLVNNGYWRDVWMVREFDGSKVAAKTMRVEHDFEARNYDRHRKDALASERLTSSPYVANIYSFCGNTGVFDYADEGDIDMLIWNDDENDEYSLPKLQKVELALQVARGIAAAHNFSKEGRASLAHTDISRKYILRAMIWYESCRQIEVMIVLTFPPLLLSFILLSRTIHLDRWQIPIK